jgi:hypothetical protein
MPGMCIRETIIKPKHRAQIKRIPLLERFPKSVTRFSDKKRDQAKNRERFPIRMKREPL